MLSHEWLEKVRRFNSQYGEGEDTFSLDWHAKNPVPQEGAILTDRIAGKSNDTTRSVKVILGYVADPATGDVRIAQYKSEEERDTDPLKSE